MCRNKGTQEIENALSKFYEIAADNKESLPIQQESKELRITIIYKDVIISHANCCLIHC